MGQQGPRYEVDRELSNQAAASVQADRTRCYHSARRALLEVPALKEARYVEGWVIDLRKGGALPPTEHAWLELDGRVIEPTQPDALYFYFPVMRFDQAAVRRWVPDADDDVPFIRQYYARQSPEHKRYAQALSEAMQLCNEYFGITRPLDSEDSEHGPA